jgi:hypothetical protein
MKRIILVSILALTVLVAFVPFSNAEMEQALRYVPRLGKIFVSPNCSL